MPVEAHLDLTPRRKRRRRLLRQTRKGVYVGPEGFDIRVTRMGLLNIWMVTSAEGLLLRFRTLAAVEDWVKDQTKPPAPSVMRSAQVPKGI